MQGFAAGSGMGGGALAGSIAGGLGIGALNPATSLLTGMYGQFDGSAGGTQSVTAPSGAPKGGLGGRGTASGASSENKGGVGPTAQEKADLIKQRLAEMPDERNACEGCYLPNPVHDLPPAARAAMNTGYLYSAGFILGGGAAGRLAGWALTRLGFAAAGASGSGIAVVAERFGERNASIFERAAEIIAENGGSAKYVDHLSALAKAVGEKVPMGQVWWLGELNGKPIFGAIRNGLGIVETEGGTMIVHAPQGGPVTVLGNMIP